MVIGLDTPSPPVFPSALHMLDIEEMSDLDIEAQFCFVAGLHGRCHRDLVMKRWTRMLLEAA